MYILVHFLASSFPDEKLDTVWNHWLPVSTVMYMDVQQLKMVQMVSQSQFFRGFYLLYLMRLPWLRVWNAAFLIVKKLDGHYNSCYIKDMVSFYHICEALKKRWISTIISEMLKKRRVSAIKWKPKNARFYKGAGNGSFFLRNLWNSIT